MCFVFMLRIRLRVREIRKRQCFVFTVEAPAKDRCAGYVLWCVYIRHEVWGNFSVCCRLRSAAADFILNLHERQSAGHVK